MSRRKLTSFHKDLLVALGFMLVGVLFILLLKDPSTVTEEEKRKPGIVSELPPKIIEIIPITPEEEVQNAVDLAAASDYIQDNNLSRLLQTVIGFTKEDFDGSPPIHTQLMILLFKVNNYEIRESDGLDASNNVSFFLDTKIAKKFLDEMFITLDFETATVPEALSTFVSYKGDDIYLRRLTFNTERTKITKATEVVIDNETYIELHTTTYMLDSTIKGNIRNLYRCDVTVKVDEASPYGYKIKSITNFTKLQ